MALTCNSFFEFQRALSSISAEWYELGLRLGLPSDMLNNISRAMPLTYKGYCMTSMLLKWQQVFPTSGWSDIVSALEAMERNYLATKIKEKYCKEPDLDVADRGGMDDTPVLWCCLPKRVKAIDFDTTSASLVYQATGSMAIRNNSGGMGNTKATLMVKDRYCSSDRIQSSWRERVQAIDFGTTFVSLAYSTTGSKTTRNNSGGMGNTKATLMVKDHYRSSDRVQSLWRGQDKIHMYNTTLFSSMKKNTESAVKYYVADSGGGLVDRYCSVTSSSIVQLLVLESLFDELHPPGQVRNYVKVLNKLLKSKVLNNFVKSKVLNNLVKSKILNNLVKQSIDEFHTLRDATVSLIKPCVLVSDISLSGGGNIEIQHSIDPYSDSIKSLKFIFVNHCQESNKLKLSVSEKGHFSMHSQYGKLHVDKPVIAAIVYEPPKNNSSQYPEMVYRQHVVYENVGKNTWMMSYVVTPNLYSIEKDIVELAKGDVQSEKFHFAGDCITLDIPTVESQDGWSVTPQSAKNYITQKEACHFFMSPTESEIPVISVLLHHEGNEDEALHVKVKVAGAKENITFFIQRFFYP